MTGFWSKGHAAMQLAIRGATDGERQAALAAVDRMCNRLRLLRADFYEDGFCFKDWFNRMQFTDEPIVQRDKRHTDAIYKAAKKLRVTRMQVDRLIDGKRRPSRPLITLCMIMEGIEHK